VKVVVVLSAPLQQQLLVLHCGTDTKHISTHSRAKSPVIDHRTLRKIEKAARKRRT
jgi:hypothetical protein